jgi:hypothetical protein
MAEEQRPEERHLQRRRFRAVCRDCHLRQEFVTPYTLEQIELDNWSLTIRPRYRCQRQLNSDPPSSSIVKVNLTHPPIIFPPVASRAAR